MQSLYLHTRTKNNLLLSWLIAFGDFTGGRLWLESPIGTHPPPAPQTAWGENLRGEFHDVKNAWVRFDPQLYHAVGPITSGSRRSLALFMSKNWKRLPPHCLDDLIGIGFYPPHSALSTDAAPTSSDAAALPNSIQTSSCAIPTGSIATCTLTLADPSVHDVPSTSLLSSGACVDSSDLATLLLGPLPSEALTLRLPQPDEERTLQEWCSSELVFYLLLLHLHPMALSCFLTKQCGKSSLIIFDQVTLFFWPWPEMPSSWRPKKNL